MGQRLHSSLGDSVSTTWRELLRRMNIHLFMCNHSHNLGQVSSVAIASAVFQSRLDAELRRRIHVPGADKVSLRFRLPCM